MVKIVKVPQQKSRQQRPKIAMTAASASHNHRYNNDVCIFSTKIHDLTMHSARCCVTITIHWSGC